MNYPSLTASSKEKEVGMILFEWNSFIWTRQTLCKNNKNTISSSFMEQDVKNPLPVEFANFT